jgi:hypothetical protein
MQSIGVWARDLEGINRIFNRHIIFPTILLNAVFYFFLVLATYFQQMEHIKEGTNDGGFRKMRTPEVNARIALVG